MDFANFATIAFISLLIFLVCRELVCWYWKINKTTELLTEILAELRESNGKVGAPNDEIKRKDF